jgi:hypothetical protein
MVEKHARWAAGAVNKHPEIGCCACGRWKLQLPDVSNSIAKALEGIDDGAAPTNSSEQPRRIVHAEALQGVADEVPCWSTKSPNVPWGTSPFCPAWPRYGHDNGSTLTAEQRALLRAAVRRAVAPFAQSGISREKCALAPSQRAKSTLCHPLPSPPPPLPAAAATVTRAAHLSPAGCKPRCAPSVHSGSASMCRSSRAACWWWHRSPSSASEAPRSDSPDRPNGWIECPRKTRTPPQPCSYIYMIALT